MTRDTNVKHFKVLQVPNNPPVPNAVFYVLNSLNKVDTYITDKNGIPTPLYDREGLDNITSPDNSITISSLPTEIQLSINQNIQDIISSALQPGGNISELNNDAGYITLADIETNLAYQPNPINGVVTNDNGTGFTVPTATTTNAGLLNASDKTKLDSVQANAEQNVNADWNAVSGDAQILNKPSTFPPSSHTHPISDVTGLQTALDNKSNVGHTHIIADVTGLQTALDGKAPTVHTHTSSQITDFTTAVDARVNPRIEDIIVEGVTTKAPSQNAVFDALATKANVSHTHIINDVTGLQTALNLKEDKANKGIANGYAPLDSNNKVPLIHINDAILGQVKYKGLYDASTNTPALPSATTNKGDYYVVSVAGTQFGLNLSVGDWIISNGTTYDKIDNTDAVTTVFGRTGNVIAQNGDYTTAQVTETANKNYQTDNQKLFNDATSSIQTQLNNKASLVHTHVIGDVTGLTQALEVKTENSAGAMTGFVLTDNGNGTVNITSGEALLRNANSAFAPIQKYTIPAVTNLAMVDNSNNFICVDYNGGTPAITTTTTTTSIEGRTKALIYVVARVGTVLDYVKLIEQNTDSNAKLRNRFLNTEGLARAQGAVLSFSARNIAVTGGLFYSGLLPVQTPAFSTGTGSTFTQVYDNAGTWIRTTGNTQINNTQYNNAGTLTNLSNNDFRVDYVYVLANNPSKLYVVLGNQAYTNIASARLSTKPATLPTELQILGTLVGRVIIQRLAANISESNSSYDTIFQSSQVQLHNDLGGLNNGDFQHLTQTEKTYFNSIPTLLAGKENTITAGTTLQYYRGDKTFQTLNTAAVPELTNLYYTNARGIGSVLTGYVSGAGTVAATDTILQTIQKLNGNDLLRAPLASPAFTGTPTAPTATAGTNTTQLATTAFVTNVDAGNVKLTGTQTITGIKTFSSQLNSESFLTFATNSVITNGQILITRKNNRIAILSDPAGASGFAIFNTDAITVNSDKTFSFPNQSGVFALTNNPTSITAQSFIKSGGTASQFLKADGSVDSNSYALASSTHNPVTLGTANGLSLNVSTQVLSLGLASGSTNGALSSTDWNTFNNKQNALTNPITGTGTTNYLPKFTGGGTLGNSTVMEAGGFLTIGSSTIVSTNATDGFVISNATDSNKQLIIGYDSTNNQSRIQSIQQGTSTRALLLNPIGGQVLVGTTTNNGVDQLQVNGSGSFSGGFTIFSGSLTVPNTTASQFILTSLGAEKKIYVGDGTGYSLSFLKKQSGVETLLARINDSGTNLEVNSTISASPATASNHVVVKSQLDAVAPVKIYKAEIVTAGINQVFKSNMGTITLTNPSTGVYNLNSSSEFTSGKTYVSISSLNGVSGQSRTFSAVPVSSSIIEIKALNNGTLSNTINEFNISVEVYN